MKGAPWKKQSYRDARFSDAAKAVAQFISDKVHADVLVLTEVGNRADVKELNEHLRERYPYLEVCDCSDNRTKQHVAVLSRFKLYDFEEKIPGREGFHGELDDPESESDTGISKGMTVRFQAAGKAFRLYAVHLASEAGGHKKDAQRVAQASILRRHVLKSINAGEHVIVAGDLNDRRGQPALRRVRGFDDIGPDLIQTGHEKYFADGEKDQRWTYVYKGQRQQIDHILLSWSIKGSIKKRKGLQTKAGPTPQARVSDHRPLVVILKFPPPNGSSLR